jgi:DNA excision repair protein ERCC-4
MVELLPYENQIFLDLYHEDGLLVMAEGLGLERIFLNFIKLYCDPSHLIMIVNTNEAEEKYFISKLQTEHNTAHLPQRITTGATRTYFSSTYFKSIENSFQIETHTMNERVQAYLKGGSFFITSRILVTDMLTERIPIDLINGILVYRAHRLIDSCQESFILRLFRQKNKTGFIKAFSDDPIHFVRSKVERVMKNLFVKKLFVFPRFHVDIESTFDKYKPEVVEVHVQLSSYSHAIQMALLDIINVLVQELKGCCTYVSFSHHKIHRFRF